MSSHISRLWPRLLDAHKPLNPGVTWSDPVAYLLGTFPNNYIEYENQMIKSRKYWVSSRFINIIYRTLTFFSTNDRDRNINIAFENSCKIRTIHIKANWTCCSTISFIVSASISIFSFIIAVLWNTRTKMKERYAVYKYNSSLSL